MDVLLAIIAITVLSSFIDWVFFNTRCANKCVYQFCRKDMWRKPLQGIDKEKFKQTQVGEHFFVSLMFAVLFVIFWTVFQPGAPAWVISVLAWFAILVPYIMFESIHIDLHPRYVTQHAVAWLVRLVMAGLIVGTLL